MTALVFEAGVRVPLQRGGHRVSQALAPIDAANGKTRLALNLGRVYGIETCLPRRFKRCHRLLPARSVAPVVHAVWNAGRDRPKPAAICGRRVRPQDTADRLSVSVENLEIVGKIAAAEVGLSQEEHGGHHGSCSHAALKSTNASSRVAA